MAFKKIKHFREPRTETDRLSIKTRPETIPRLVSPVASKPRVISLVPSWTETLISLGAEVVGRTRYCIHPEQEIMNIPVLGGTKKISWDEVSRLKPDLVIMDKEENTLEMAESCPYAMLATHVRSIDDLPRELLNLEQACKLEMKTLSQRWQQVLDAEPLNRAWVSPLPGQIAWLHGDPTEPIQNVIYVIWKKPWMAVGEGCFIWSVLKKLGLACIAPGAGRYPEFDFAEYSRKGCSFLFSSEPYPFDKNYDSLVFEAGQSAALVDGELYSWFGTRSLKFLEEELSLKAF